MPALITRMGKRLRRLIERPGSAELSRYEALLPTIGELESELAELDDAALTERAGKLRLEAEFGDTQLVEVCALGREAAKRALGERAFDVQLLGTMGLLTGHVVQMETGEGKTLSGALAAAGFALQGKRVHVTTVNDYLARRDAEWMRPVYDLLGVSVSWVGPTLTRDERREAYSREVTYGAVSEIGFDVLRDRLVTRVEDLVQPEPEVAIVDEADSVLVDEARVPLVMAGSVDHTDADVEVANVVRRLRLGLHYETDSDGRNAWLTAAGASVVEKALGGIDLYDDSGADRLAAVNVALHAHALLTRDVDYLVRDGKVQLINASRGRVAELQRWPDGLQAAVEAKEQVAATDRGEILDSITVQALMARYPQVAGMTGTAVAVAEQLREFYKLEVAVIPPNTPNIRTDEPDRIYASPSQKLRAIEAEIREVHETGRPILVGTQDVAESEELAEKLEKDGMPCVVLNARNDAEEAAIIAEAGKYGAVTVSTQMAGRGTDIRLGGADGADRERVAELGGLHVIGTARYPSSRLDGQLRGRSGRQGDPGSAVFFASLNDELVLSNAPDVPEGIHADEETGLITDPAAQRQINHAQRVAEGVHLEIHRNTWRYTRLIEHQRGELLKHRDELLRTGLAAEKLKEAAPKRYEELAEKLDEEALAQLCREIMLFHLDELWSDHLAYLTDVRESIHLRAIARETPLDEFHRLAIPEFHKIVPTIEERSVKTFEEAEVGDDGIDLGASGVRRPSSTWTYLVHDSPFDSDFEQTLKQVRSLIKRK
ncbi:preprotein translocase subunit SecA [Amycolatopsis bartoniae]|uniref:Protein translocase subunit SecA n=1 Tax=Amycolatopsis bartoniae TaxID=941986 RepID=A0A8H9M925_9PSEU|nr:accessory Sec system translocase SecA2 [Amycolatopsis bartoniae]MBB2938804.1 preprotein translocase subunit SecA [Amycolatopsis bartoniae]TVS99208.1 accessory Sec system translocase SecA2 [Amycolatopsis bartoniae]GHF89068.1 protein translocase subunit SecA [Amycolatopsis bartoniae]